MNGDDDAGAATQTRESKGIDGLSRGRLEAREQRWWELELLVSMATAVAQAQSEEGASRGEGERVRERGNSGIHFWRAQRHGREAGAAALGNGGGALST